MLKRQAKPVYEGGLVGFQGWLTIKEAMKHQRLHKFDGTRFKVGSVTALCNRSVAQEKRGETPVFRLNDGKIGVRFYGNRWFIHIEALENFVPPIPGNPNFAKPN